MINCAKETENEKDHVVIPTKGSLIEGSNSLPTRPRTYSDVKARVIYNGEFVYSFSFFLYIVVKAGSRSARSKRRKKKKRKVLYSLKKI